jgi:methyl-accepting chemotaxis protein
LLRRKLILTLGSLIAMMLVASLWAIILYESAIDGLSETGNALLDRTALVIEVEDHLGQIELRLQAVRDDPRVASVEVADGVDELVDQLSEIEVIIRGPEATDHPLTGLAGRLGKEMHEMAAALPDVAEVDHTATHALRTAMAIRHELGQLSRVTQQHYQIEYDRLLARLRWWALGLSVTFLLVINLSIMGIIRAAAMVVRPVDQLVEASRRLAREEFDHRVEVRGSDEFAELARATNGLAEQLQTNEQRRIETLQQVARTMGHELNNAIAIIDLQLRLAARDGELNKAGSGEHLHQIHEALSRMTRTVGSLSQIRRVVLTDYVGEQKMVDLTRSAEDVVEPEEQPSESAGAPAAR